MPDYYTQLLPGEKCHIFSRAIGNEKLFCREDNYRFFLARYEKYILPLTNTYSYCLLPNHFHFLMGIKDEADIAAYYTSIKRDRQIETVQMPTFVMQQFSNMLNSYAKAFNKVYSRKGALFMDFLRRTPIEKEEQLLSTMFYIHKNRVHHGYCAKMQDWKWSSYNTMFSQKPTILLRDEILGWYGGIKHFMEYHSQPIDLKKATGLEFD